MKRVTKQPVETIDQWLEIATEGLVVTARDRIKQEIGTHFTEMVNEFQNNGMSQSEAEATALRKLGRPADAAKSFRKHHLTEREKNQLARWHSLKQRARISTSKDRWLTFFHCVTGYVGAFVSLGNLLTKGMQTFSLAFYCALLAIPLGLIYGTLTLRAVSSPGSLATSLKEFARLQYKTSLREGLSYPVMFSVIFVNGNSYSWNWYICVLAVGTALYFPGVCFDYWRLSRRLKKFGVSEINSHAE